MCTRVMWADGQTGVLVGRNMDWRERMDTNLWVLPRGADRVGLPEDANPLVWTAAYGSVVATAWDMATTDGVNERGLATHLLWLAESDFGARDPARPVVSTSLWSQFFLDRFATVQEAVAFLDDHPIQVAAQAEPHSGRMATVHLVLDDATGDSAIIEYLDGQPRLHHDRAFQVTTNSPPFEQQLAHLRHYEGFGGARPLPGTTEASDRFVRASYYAARRPRAQTPAEAYAAMLAIMRNAAQPFGVPDPARPNISATIWRTLADLTARVYAFESSFRPDIVWVRLDRIDFDRSQRLDLAAADLVGDVTDRFATAEPFRFR